MFVVPAEYLLSDNGSQFISKELASYLREHGVLHTFTAKYSPQVNASERVNSSILSGIRAYVKDGHKNWGSNLDEINMALRSRVHDSTSFSPYVLIFELQCIGNGKHHKLIRQLKSID